MKKERNNAMFSGYVLSERGWVCYRRWQEGWEECVMKAYG